MWKSFRGRQGVVGSLPQSDAGLLRAPLLGTPPSTFPKGQAMSDLNMTEAFREYGAQLRSRLSDASAIAEDGALVLSCWAHVFRPQPGGGLRYEDSISTWPTNQASRTLLAEHLQVAFDNKLPVRLVIATAKEPPTRGQNAM